MTDEDEDKAAEAFVAAYEEAVSRLLLAASLGGSTADRITQLLTSLTAGGPGPDMGKLMAFGTKTTARRLCGFWKGKPSWASTPGWTGGG